MKTNTTAPAESPMDESRPFRHTPGPWIASQAVRGQDCGFHIHTVENPHGNGLAHVYSRASGEANAALIAAAPDMLEALQYVMGDLLENRPEEQYEAVAKAIRAAIAKATTPAS